MPITSSTTANDKIVQEAHERFQRCEDWESTWRAKAIADLKFANGDSTNMWQWDGDVVAQRFTIDKRPTLTINKTRQHCLNIINDARQNKTSVSIRPVGDGASYESAQVFMGLVRHIENNSNAIDAYANAVYHQVHGGIGYWRVDTDYSDNTSFDQDIFIRRIADPLTVYLDPNIQEADGSDARFGFVFIDKPREDFKSEYPDWWKDATGDTFGKDNWDNRDTVRIAEYFRIVDSADMLFNLPPGLMAAGDQGGIVAASQLDPAMVELLMSERSIQRRSIPSQKVEKYKIAGHRVIEETLWPGKYIPIVRCVGEETVIEGKLDRKGHVRALIDPQRMYNWNSSSQIEVVAGQTKTPWMASARAIEGYEDQWFNANVKPPAVLIFNDMDETGAIDRPSRVQPPVSSEAALQGMKVAENEMMMASGQYQADFGMPSNEKSGVAIQQRQRQSDVATYHYVDRQAQAVRFTGKILIDLIPKIYDTQRVMRVMGEDGSENHVMVDPQSPDAHQPVKNPAQDPQQKISAIFNPNVGRYAVEADVGPSYATKRQEAFNALSQIMSQNQEAMKIGGDLMWKAADFPDADILAERWKRTIPPQILDDDGNAAQQAQQQQFNEFAQHARATVQQLTQEKAELEAKLKDRAIEQEREEFRAQTDRLRAVGAVDPESLKLWIREAMSQFLGGPVVPLIQAHAIEDQHTQNVMAQMAADAAPQQQPAPGQQ